MFKIMQKLKTAKHNVKDWSKKYFGNIHDKLTRNVQKIEYVEGRLTAQPNSYRFQAWMHRP